MGFIFALGLIFFVSGNSLGVGGQVSEGVPCETPAEEYGTCISIYNCNRLLNLLVTQSNNPRVRTFLRSSTCGYIGSTPMVCCPPEPRSQTENPIFSSTEGSTPTNKINTGSTLPKEPNCGRANATNPRIVNGIPAKLGEFPWIVALGYRNSKNAEQPKWLCGGSLITDRHILTAAHCVHNRQDLYVARLGDLDLYSETDGADPDTIPLVNAKVHENYSPVNFTSDIAILTLERSPRKTTAWPLCLPAEGKLRTNNYVNSRPTVAGWGSLYFNGPSSPTLQEVILPVLDNELCKRAYASKSVIDERVMCAGYLQGNKDACQGDSGGPLMHRQQALDEMNQTKITFYQIGIVSYGLRCAEAGYPGVYTRVTAFVDWIQRNVN